jgi:hypothetical protein
VFNLQLSNVLPVLRLMIFDRYVKDPVQLAADVAYPETLRLLTSLNGPSLASAFFAPLKDRRGSA